MPSHQPRRRPFRGKKRSAARRKPASGKKPAAGRRPARKKGPHPRPAGKPFKRKTARAASQSTEPDPRGERLQKILAAAGVASRRECEQLILEGRVVVDDETVTELGARVDPFKQRIAVDGEALLKPKRQYFAVNKPEGVVCTARDPSGRPRVTDLLPPSAGRLFNVGRLDMASEGLILMTNDGEFANRLSHPRHGVHKTYHVQVSGHPTAESLRELRKGVRLAEGTAHFVNARIKGRRKNGTILEVVLDEGRNREIRRVLARVGHKVQRLKRVAVGPIKLGELPSGAYRPLTREELKAVDAYLANPPEPTTPVTRPPRAPRTGGAKPKAEAPKRRPGPTIIGGGDEPPAKKPTRKKTKRKR